MIKIALLLIYLLIGYLILTTGIEEIGGVEEYKRQLQNDFQFILAIVLVIVFWPYFLLKAIYTK